MKRIRLTILFCAMFVFYAPSGCFYIPTNNEVQKQEQKVEELNKTLIVTDDPFTKAQVQKELEIETKKLEDLKSNDKISDTVIETGSGYLNYVFPGLGTLVGAGLMYYKGRNTKKALVSTLKAGGEYLASNPEVEEKFKETYRKYHIDDGVVDFVKEQLDKYVKDKLEEK